MTQFSLAKQFNFSIFSVKLKEPYWANFYFLNVPAFCSSINEIIDLSNTRRAILPQCFFFKTLHCSSEATAERNNIALLWVFCFVVWRSICLLTVHAFEFNWLSFILSFSNLVHIRIITKISKCLPFSLIISFCMGLSSQNLYSIHISNVLSIWLAYRFNKFLSFNVNLEQYIFSDHSQKSINICQSIYHLQHARKLFKWEFCVHLLIYKQRF